MKDDLSSDQLNRALEKLFCLTLGAQFSVEHLPLSKLRSLAQTTFSRHTSDREHLVNLLMQILDPALKTGSILFYEPGGRCYYWYKQFADRFERVPRYDLSDHPLVTDLSKYDQFLQAFEAVGGMINGQKRLHPARIPLPKDQHEAFVDILAEAGVLRPAGPNEHGIKGTVWNINTKLFDHVQAHIDRAPVEIRLAA